MRNNGWTCNALARYFKCNHSSIIYQCNLHKVRPTNTTVNKAFFIRIQNRKKIERIEPKPRTDSQVNTSLKEFRDNPVDEDGEKIVNKSYEQLLAEAEKRSERNKLKASDLFY